MTVEELKNEIVSIEKIITMRKDNKKEVAFWKKILIETQWELSGLPNPVIED